MVTASDYSEALHFYRDVLGLTERAAYSSADGHATVLEAGWPTLEINEPAYAAHIDEVEVGRRVAGHVRVAFEVADSASVTQRPTDAGARLIAAPVETPWGSLNSRLEGPGGLQLTLFSSP